MALPETCYARNGDARIAYQVVGEGEIDLVMVPGLVSHLDLTWKIPEHARFCEALARFSRLILFDKRGTGLSDRDKGVPGLEQRMDDLLAVMAAAGSRRAALFGNSEGGMMSLLFAATYPERVRALVLYGAFVHSPTRAWLPEQVETRFDLVERGWGTGLMPPSVAPSKASDQEFRRNWARFERQSASGAMAAALLRIDREVDISAVLPAVHVPTLLMHRSGDRRIAVENGRHLAARLPGATYIELPGMDHLPHVGDSARIIAETERFVAHAANSSVPQFALATVLAVGGVAAELREFALGQVASGGGMARGDDGFLAVFDGPARAVGCALTIAGRARSLGIAVRSGLHTGEIPRTGGAGDAGVIASRIAELATSGEVMVSGTVRDLVAGSGLRFEGRGAPQLRGVAEAIPLYAALDG